jgi:hypothetical protein
VTGRNIGGYRVPRVLDTDSADVFFRVVLTVTNSRGQSASTSRDVQPLLGKITLRYNVPNLQMKFDGQTVTTPFSFTGVVGSVHVLESITPQDVDGSTFVTRRIFPRRFVAVGIFPQTFIGRFFKALS